MLRSSKENEGEQMKYKHLKQHSKAGAKAERLAIKEQVRLERALRVQGVWTRGTNHDL